jgi:LuxR family transcriptional regulator, maltose regulon positive regulatory protein
MRNIPASSEDTKDLTGERVLLVTKLGRPLVRADLVTRPRLTNLLHLGLHCPLTLIAAPAGFGKTTVVSAWLESTPVLAAWISLEHSDDDLPRFWSYMFTALERVHPGCGESALALLRGADPQQLPPIETILTVWINGLASLASEVVLILDDYHLITAQAIHHSVTYLLDHLPPHLHLVLATRADPPLPLARLRMQGHLTEIRAANLRFTAEETAAFLTQMLGRELSGEDIATLEARTEGWIAGLQLAALAMQGRTDLPSFLAAFSGSHHYIIDYLVEEVLARQPEPVQTFLLQTAILERLQGSLCEAVMGEPGGEGSGQVLLEQIEQANLFLTPLDEEWCWYRYHQLFAEALRHRLQRQQPTLVPALHQRASAWYEQHGLILDAVHHALAATDFALAVRLIEHAFPALVRRGEIATLQRWVSALPEELLRSNVELAVLQGWLLVVSGKHSEALRHLEAMEQTFGLDQLSTEQPGQQALQPESFSQATTLGRIAAIRASIALTQGDLPRTITLSRLALEYLPNEHMARSYVAGYLGQALYFDGDIEAARMALDEARRVSWEVQHPYGLFLVIYDLAHLQILQGQLSQADQTCRQALQQTQEQGGNQPARGPALVVRGQLAREWNELDLATSLLQEGITLCEQSANTRVLVHAYIELALIQQARGETTGARALMQQAVQRAERQRIAPSRGTQEVEAFQAWLFLLQGDEASSFRWLQSSGLSLEQDVTHVREREYLTVVRILITRHRLDEAIKWLAHLLPLAETQGRAGSVIELLMLQAEALQAFGEVHQALEHLARALTLAEPEGYLRLFVDEGLPMTQLLQQMRRRWPDQQPHYRDHLLALLGSATDAGLPHPAVAGPGGPPQSLALSDRELAVLRLIVAGYSNQEIANRLVIAVSTVKWYINTIFSKLQVESRAKAIARARDLHLVE